jgi:hypothetical protein
MIPTWWRKKNESPYKKKQRNFVSKNTYLLLLPSLLIDNSHGQFREITQHFSHLVTTLSATDVDNAIRVGKLGKRLTNDSLSATESPRHGTSSTKHRGEEPINDTQTSNQRSITGQLLRDGTRASDRPEMAEGEFVDLVLGLVEHVHDDIIDEEGLLSVSSSGVDFLDSSPNVGRADNLVAFNKFVFVDFSNHVSSSDGLSLFEGTGSKCPANVSAQAGDIHTLGHVDVTGTLENALQGTLDTIENGSHDT